MEENCTYLNTSCNELFILEINNYDNKNQKFFSDGSYIYFTA